MTDGLASGKALPGRFSVPLHDGWRDQSQDQSDVQWQQNEIIQVTQNRDEVGDQVMGLSAKATRPAMISLASPEVSGWRATRERAGVSCLRRRRLTESPP
jgi:hypothetical protein